jgi:hypothetical protein
VNQGIEQLAQCACLCKETLPNTNLSAMLFSLQPNQAQPLKLCLQLLPTSQNLLQNLQLHVLQGLAMLPA